MRNQIITVIPIGDISSYIIDHIRESLTSTFNIAANIKPWEKVTTQNPATIYGRHNSASIIKHLSERVPEDSFKVLTVTDLDLFSMIFSCLFGEAQLNGPCALISLYRLRQEFYNLNSDRELFLNRCEKEAIHEIAHTFGLLHCKDKKCVMYASNNIIETDEKLNTFCSSCSELLAGLDLIPPNPPSPA